jgi:hypothetical protein
VLGLSSQGWHELLSQLPVHVEDTLSQDSIEATRRAIGAFDEHLEFRVIPLEGGRAELEINAPGATAANREERAVTHPEAEKEGARRLFFPAAGGVTIMPLPARSETLLSGRTLRLINVRGLSEQSHDELVLRLPVHVGDTLSRDSMKAIGIAVRQFDEHLELNLIPIENGGVELRIVAPGTGLR